LIYTVFVPNYLKVSNSPENSIENKIKQFIGTEQPFKIVFTDDFFISGEKILSDGNSFYIDWLSEIPPVLNKGLVLAALSERGDSMMQLLYGERALEPKNFLKFNKNGIIGTLNYNPMLDIETIMPAIKTELYDSMEKLTSAFNESEIHAVLIPAHLSNYFVSEIPLVNKQNFHFTEIIPSVGSGVLCAITLENATETRKFLRTAHHLITAECVNVERQLNILANELEISAYVYTDAQHYFHLYAALKTDDLEYKKIQLSRSTTFELAETAWEALKV